MGETILFCFVFLSQVLLISWFYPRRVISNSKYVLQNFPPSTHPRLYPYPPEYFERWHRNIERFNLVMVVAGFLIIGLILGALAGEWDGGIFASSRKNDWVEFIVVPFFLVQFVAGMVYMNSSRRKILQAMANAPPPRVRTTELRRRITLVQGCRRYCQRRVRVSCVFRERRYCDGRAEARSLPSAPRP
jgi:hypothetical protein